MKKNRIAEIFNRRAPWFLSPTKKLQNEIFNESPSISRVIELMQQGAYANMLFRGYTALSFCVMSYVNQMDEAEAARKKNDMVSYGYHKQKADLRLEAVTVMVEASASPWVSLDSSRSRSALYYLEGMDNNISAGNKKAGLYAPMEKLFEGVRVVETSRPRRQYRPW